MWNRPLHSQPGCAVLSMAQPYRRVIVNTLIHLSHQNYPVLHACVAALIMLGLGLEGMDTNLDAPQKFRN